MNAHRLATEQLAQFDRDGFLVLPAYFDAATVNAMAKAADALLSGVGAVEKANPRVQIDIIGQEARVRQVYPLIDISPYFAELAGDRRLLDIFESLFNDKPVLFEDKLNYKYPSGGTSFPMHQDFSYWEEFSPLLTTALIYIDEATPENGCLEVVAGFHKNGLLARDMTQVGLNLDHNIPAETVPPELAQQVPGAAGTLILFSSLTPHSSSPNTSSRARRAIIYTFSPAGAGDWYEQEAGANRDKALRWNAERTAPVQGN